MKKSLLLFCALLGTALLVSTTYAQSVIPAKWTVTTNKAWFAAASNNVRGLGYNPVNNRLYVPSREPGINAVIILNAATGDSVGALNMTGVTGGTFAFNRLAVSADGRIYTTNLVTAVNTTTARLKIYSWASDTSAPVVAFNDSIQGPRLGDALAVVGSGQETYVYVSGNAAPGPVHVFKRSGDTLVVRKSILPTSWGAFGVLGIGPVTNGFGSFWINVSGRAASAYDTTGTPLDTIPGGIVASGASSAHYFEYAGRKYVGAYSGNPNASNPSVVRFADVTDKGSASFVAGITASMGTVANSNATGEVYFSAADTSFYAISSNNAIAKFDLKAAMPVVAVGTRAPFVPMAGENDTVNFTITSMKPITSANIKYYGKKTSVSDQAGDDSAASALTMVNHRSYRGIVPGSANRDGRRINFLADVSDNLNVKAAASLIPGYYAGTTKLGFIGGPRDVDTLGQLFFKGYGIRSQIVITVEDSIFQVANNEIVGQDSLGGVTVFVAPSTFNVTRGNLYTVTGTTDNPTGGGSKFQFVNPGVSFTDHGVAPKPVVPRVATIKQIIQNGELWENTLVEVRNVTKTPGSLAWPTLGQSNNMMFVDASGDSATVRIDGDTNIDGTPEPAYPITIVGVAGQFDSSSPFTSGYQWLPRDTSDIKPMYVPPPPPPARQAVTVKNSKITMAVTNVGHIGALDAYQDKAGFVYAAADRLYEGSLIMGNAKNRVPNAARFQAAPSWNPGFRFRTNIKVDTVGTRIRTESAFDDSMYSNPLGIWINQVTSLDTAVGKDGYALFGYNVINKSGTAINNFRFGSFLDFDMTAAGDADRGAIVKDSTNTIPGVNNGNKFKFMVAYTNNGSTYAGIVPLTHSDFTGGRIATGPAEVYSGRMVDSNKFNYIATWRPTNTYTDGGTPDDISIFTSVGPYNINPGDTAIAAFGLVVGSSLQELVNNARAAQVAAVTQNGVKIAILTGVGEQQNSVPVAFALEQNYPNPFNPSTTIRFALPNAGNVRLAVYDILGREVRSLVGNAMDAGYHQITWDGKNNLGTSVASGVYIYRIESGSFISTKKMMLMK